MKTECARIQEVFRFGTSTPEQERHLFSCADCRTQVRLSQAWKMLPPLSELETPPSPDEIFVARVLAAVRRDRRRRARLRTTLAAAATLLFFFLAGAGSRMTSASTVGAEEAYAQLAGPSELEGLLPD